jgi:hypothetical protein
MDKWDGGERNNSCRLAAVRSLRRRRRRRRRGISTWGPAQGPNNSCRLATASRLFHRRLGCWRDGRRHAIETEWNSRRVTASAAPRSYSQCDSRFNRRNFTTLKLCSTAYKKPSLSLEESQNEQSSYPVDVVNGAAMQRKSAQEEVNQLRTKSKADYIAYHNFSKLEGNGRPVRNGR